MSEIEQVHAADNTISSIRAERAQMARELRSQLLEGREETIADVRKLLSEYRLERPRYGATFPSPKPSETDKDLAGNTLGTQRVKERKTRRARGRRFRQTRVSHT